MGLFDFLFGGGESKTVTTPWKELLWTPEQKKLADLLIQQVFQGLQGPMPEAPQMYVPKTPAEEQYFDLLSGAARSKALQDLLAGRPGYEVGPEWAQQYFEEAIKPAYEKAWREETLPAIRESYAGPIYEGSARREAVRKSSEDLALQLAQAKAGLTYGEELARRKAIDTAYGRLIPSLVGAEATFAKPAALERAIEHEKVADALQRYLMGEEVGGAYNPAYNPYMQIAMSLLGLMPYGLGARSVGESERTGGLLQGIADILGAYRKGS